VGNLYLALAIVSEVIATSALKSSNGFSNLWPSVIVVAGYGVAFYMLSLVLETMNVGLAYAIWAGLGIVLVSIVGALMYKQVPDLPAILGMGLIVAGVLIINVYSKTAVH
jgi:small multidrug resistance pump